MLSFSSSNPEIAIAGRVLDKETEEIISGAIIEITEMPEEFSKFLELKELQYGAQWEKMRERPDRKISAVDGSFYFTNLPVGEYTLTASSPTIGGKYTAGEQTVEVSLSDEKIATAIADLFLFPTGIKGRITAEELGVEYAKVQIQDSGESTLSDKDGYYSLLGLESPDSGSREVTLKISAKGYDEQVFESISIERGVVTEEDIALQTSSKYLVN